MYAHKICAQKGHIMHANIFNPDAPKKSTNLSINSDLLRQAKEHQINLSKALEQRLSEMLRQKKRLKWKEDNRDAIDDYNRRIEANRVFSEGLRSF
jgi:antitoxin CcdA